MKLINKLISKEEATYYMHNHSNIFSFPIYHESIIDPYKCFNRHWERRYNDTYIFLNKLFSDVISVKDKIIYDFTCNIGTNSFLVSNYKPTIVYGIDTDYICLLIAHYIKKSKFNNYLIYFIEGDITNEKVITDKKDTLGLLVNLPFNDLKSMYDQVHLFLDKNATDCLITDSLYDIELEDLFMQYYKQKEQYNYYSVYSGIH